MNRGRTVHSITDEHAFECFGNFSEPGISDSLIRFARSAIADKIRDAKRVARALELSKIYIWQSQSYEIFADAVEQSVNGIRYKWTTLPNGSRIYSVLIEQSDFGFVRDHITAITGITTGDNYGLYICMLPNCTCGTNISSLPARYTPLRDF